MIRPVIIWPVLHFVDERVEFRRTGSIVPGGMARLPFEALLSSDTAEWANVNDPKNSVAHDNVPSITATIRVSNLIRSGASAIDQNLAPGGRPRHHRFFCASDSTACVSMAGYDSASGCPARSLCANLLAAAVIAASRRFSQFPRLGELPEDLRSVDSCWTTPQTNSIAEVRYAVSKHCLCNNELATVPQNCYRNLN